MTLLVFWMGTCSILPFIVFQSGIAKVVVFSKVFPMVFPIYTPLTVYKILVTAETGLAQ